MGRRKAPKKFYVVECPYCGRVCERVTGAVIYPHRPDLAHKLLYRCEPCGAYVGTHANNGEPLGRPANHALRRARNDAHAAFDPLWKSGPMDRYRAYEWLAKAMGLKAKDTHIGHFSLEQCRRVIEAVAEFNGEALPVKYRKGGTADETNAGRTPELAGPDRKPDAASDDAA